MNQTDPHKNLTRFYIKTLKIIFLFCFIPGCGIAAIKATGFYQEIPYETLNNKIIIQAEVEGIKGKYLFDTGAPVCITYSRMQKCREKEVILQRVKDAHNNETTFQQIALQSIKLGSIGFKDIPALVFDEGNPLEYYGIDGIIGSSLFPDVVIHLDPCRKVMTIASDTSRMDLNPRYATDMERDEQNIPYIIIGLSKKLREQVMFDTGSSSFYEINEPVYHKIANAQGIVTLSKGNGVLSMGIGGMEKKSDKYRVQIDSMNLETWIFTNVITVTVNAFSSRIGNRLLEYGSVTLDFPGNKFYFVPNDTTPVDLSHKSWNVEVIASGDSLIAGFIWQSMAEQLHGGEKVVAINGKRYDKVDPTKALTTSLLWIEGEEAEITVIDRKGREKKLTIRKE